MEGYIQTDLDSGLINEIVCKVKSEGLFDQFRRECLADVDTKPAYQNLQNRVESSVSSFLDEQEWTSQVNKNQLREKIRKLITEKKFFETGIERIVDQVVNPKLNMNFVPKIEDVAYKYLGIENPSININLKLEIDTEVLSVNDLEQVSPDSENSLSNSSKTVKTDDGNTKSSHIFEDFDGKTDDLESPAFEPIEPSTDNKKKSESKEMNDDMDISDGDDEAQKQNGSIVSNIDEVKSNLSSISGLTSNDSNNSSSSSFSNLPRGNNFDQSGINNLEKMMHASDNCVAPKITLDSAAITLPLSENIISNTSDLIIDHINQDSVLSQVSSTSRLSIVTTNDTNTQIDNMGCRSDQLHITEKSCDYNLQRNIQAICSYEICEEAQMQNFNENSSSEESVKDRNFSFGESHRNRKQTIAKFDINREEIKFEGTDRKLFDVNIFNTSSDSKTEYENEKHEETEINFTMDDQNCGVNTTANIKKSLFNEDLDDIEVWHDTKRGEKSNHLSSIQSIGDNNSRATEAPKIENQRRKERERQNSKPQYMTNEITYSKEDESAYFSRKQKTSNTESSSSTSKKHKDYEHLEMSEQSRNKKVHSRRSSSSDFIFENCVFKKSNTSDKQKYRSDSQQFSISDDHFTHKEKVTPRQRSHSKDSNDGFTHPNMQTSYVNNENNIVKQSTSNNQSREKCANESENIDSHSISNYSVGVCDFKTLACNKYQHSVPAEEKKMIPSSQPVVIDQILTGNELDLKTFIGENRNDPIVSSIERSLATNVKKPKVAANMFEAKRLMKVRKQIELSNQKKIEQATVMAKQYIRTNAPNIQDGTQGIELEFVCIEKKNGKIISGPIISSPIHYVNGKHLNESDQLLPKTSLVSPSNPSWNKEEMDAANWKSDSDDQESDKCNFNGFDVNEKDSANDHHQYFLESVNKIRESVNQISKKIDQQFPVNDQFIENNRKSSDQVSPKSFRKRKVHSSSTRRSSKSTADGDNEMILANLFISKESPECIMKRDGSAPTDMEIINRESLSKKRQKTRYSNEDLFKPRPLLGISRRRRGFNCTE